VIATALYHQRDSYPDYALGDGRPTPSDRVGVVIDRCGMSRKPAEPSFHGKPRSLDRQWASRQDHDQPYVARLEPLCGQCPSDGSCGLKIVRPTR
jgi:hypothetical protein